MKTPSLRRIALLATCALLPTLSGCAELLQDYGGAASAEAKAFDESCAPVLDILRAVKARGYMTRREAARLHAWAEYMREGADELNDTASVASHNAGVYGSNPSMNRTQRLFNMLGSVHLRNESRQAAQTAAKAASLADDLDNLVATMESKGLVR